jgi:hypothetical protein
MPTPIAPDKEELTIRTGGQILGGWQRIRVTRGVELLPSHFDIELTERFPGQVGQAIIEPGQPCTVSLCDLVLAHWNLQLRFHSVCWWLRWRPSPEEIFQPIQDGCDHREDKHAELLEQHQQSGSSGDLDRLRSSDSGDETGDAIERRLVARLVVRVPVARVEAVGAEHDVELAPDRDVNSFRRAMELAAEGDHAGAAIWRRITVAIEQLTDTTGLPN